MCLIVGHIKYPDKDLVYEGLPKGINWWGNNLDRMTKNCMKIRKLAFLCENSGGGCSGSTRGNPVYRRNFKKLEH